MRIALLLLLALATLGCRTSTAGWGSGRQRSVYESDTLQFRTGRVSVDWEKHEISARWIGARSTPGSALIREVQIVVFDDANGDGQPDPDERLSANTVRETTDKVLFPAVVVPFRRRPDEVMVRMTVWTEERRKIATWQLVD